MWRLCSNKLYRVSTPTEDTKEMLIKKCIFPKDIIFLVRDPIINISKINLKKKEKIEEIFEKKRIRNECWKTDETKKSKIFN